jgi:DNA primase
MPNLQKLPVRNKDGDVHVVVETPRGSPRAAAGQDLAERDPEHYIVSSQESRRGRIFLDYLRNGRGTTAIGTYSPRVREGFPVAAPVTWSRIEAGIRPDAFTMKSPFRARSDTAIRIIRKRA